MRGDSRRGPTGTRRHWPSREDQACFGAWARRSGVAAVVMEPRCPPCRTSPRRICGCPGTGGTAVAATRARRPGSPPASEADCAAIRIAHAASKAPAGVSRSPRPSTLMSQTRTPAAKMPVKHAPTHQVEL